MVMNDPAMYFPALFFVFNDLSHNFLYFLPEIQYLVQNGFDNFIKNLSLLAEERAMQENKTPEGGTQQAEGS